MMTNKTIAILGASGHGKVVADIAQQNGFTVTFYDDAFPQKQTLEHWPVQGTTEKLISSLEQFDAIAVAIGDNQIRAEKMLVLQQAGAILPVLQHPNAVVSEYAMVNAGSVIMAGAIINPFAQIGIGAIVNTAAVVEHDCQLGNYVHISPNVALSGGCTLGDRTWVGVGSSVKQQINIGQDVVIGAGSVVVRDIPSTTLAYGNPAKVISG